MIQQQSNFYKHLVENLNVAVIILGDKLNIKFLNPAAEMLIGLANTRVDNIALPLVIESPIPLEKQLSTSVNNLQVISQRAAEWSLLMTGDSCVVDYTITPLSNGTSTELLIEVEKIDRWLKISKEEAMQAAHATSRSIIRGMAHEIKNPLGGIIGAAQLLERQYDDSDLHEYSNIIIEEANRLRNLVDRMLGPRRPPEFELLNLHELLERTLGIVSSEHDEKLLITRDYDPSIPDVSVDKEQLIQALLNLLGNAAEAMLSAKTPDAEIKLKTRVIKRHRIDSKHAQMMVCIDISDCGPGVPDALKETLFFPMVSGSAQGSGLGLSITQSIIHQHNGTIEYRSVPGDTHFLIYLPLEDDHA